MDDEVSPLMIQTMLACYCSPEPQGIVGQSTWSSQAGKDARDWLQGNDLIDTSCAATNRGKKWAEYICRTPLPIEAWVMPQRKP